MSEIKTSRKSQKNRPDLKGMACKTPSQKLHRRKVIILLPPEDDGLVAIYAANLPGVASQGHSEVEALKNIVEAFEAAFAAYREAGAEIPWDKSTPKLESGEEIRWVSVHG